MTQLSSLAKLLKKKLKEEIMMIANARVIFGRLDNEEIAFVDDVVVYLSRTKAYKFHLGLVKLWDVRVSPGQGLNKQFTIRGRMVPEMNKNPGPAEPHLLLGGKTYWVGFRIQEDPKTVDDFLDLVHQVINRERLIKKPMDHKAVDAYAAKLLKLDRKRQKVVLSRLRKGK